MKIRENFLNPKIHQVVYKAVMYIPMCAHIHILHAQKCSHGDNTASLV